MENKVIDINTLYLNIIAQYKTIVKSNRKSDMVNFLDRKEIALFKDFPEIYSQLRSLRGNVAAMVGDFNRVEKEYKLGFSQCSLDTRWEYLFDWGKAYWLIFFAVGTKEDKERAALKIIEKVNEVEANLGDVAEKEFYRIVLAGLKGFMHIYLGENSTAEEVLRNCIFTPVPIPQYNDKKALNRLFSNYFKALAVAIELKDKDLLRKLITVISIDDQTLLSEQNLFKLFHFTLMNTIDLRPEFSAEFNSFFQISPALAPAFPNLRFFIDLIRVNDQTALDRFFSTF